MFVIANHLTQLKYECDAVYMFRHNWNLECVKCKRRKFGDSQTVMYMYYYKLAAN